MTYKKYLLIFVYVFCLHTGTYVRVPRECIVQGCELLWGDGNPARVLQQQRLQGKLHTCYILDKFVEKLTNTTSQYTYIYGQLLQKTKSQRLF